MPCLLSAASDGVGKAEVVEGTEADMTYGDGNVTVLKCFNLRLGGEC